MTLKGIKLSFKKPIPKVICYVMPYIDNAYMYNFTEWQDNKNGNRVAVEK
jgi:hypothetical protein